MTRRDLKVRAAGQFLSDSDTLTIRQCLITMEKDCKDDDYAPEGVLFWQPFENIMVGEMMTHINNLTDVFEEIYNEGLKNKK